METIGGEAITSSVGRSASCPSFCVQRNTRTCALSGRFSWLRNVMVELACGPPSIRIGDTRRAAASTADIGTKHVDPMKAATSEATR